METGKIKEIGMMRFLKAATSSKCVKESFALLSKEGNLSLP